MTGDSLIQIIADDREQAGAVVTRLRADPGVGLTIARLPVGDYQVDDALLIERKTLPDLVGSIQDGRLFRQGLRLLAAPLRTAIILEGRLVDLAGRGMHRHAIQGALLTLTLFLGLPLLRALDADETAWLLTRAGRQGRTFATGALPRPGRRPRGKARVQNHVLQGLPGIGPARARRLIAHFGSVEAVVAASASELAAVPGIGAATAAAIRWAVGEAAAGYGATGEGCDPMEDWPGEATAPIGPW